MSQGSAGEKTEEPTPKKERDARAKGQVAKSQEVVTTITMISVITYVWASWNSTNTRFVALFDRVALIATGDFETGALPAIYSALLDVAMVMLPILGVAIVSGIAANYIQVGSMFSLESVTPKLEKVSPASGFKRIFSMKQVIELLKSILKITILSVLLYFVVRQSIGLYLNSLDCGIPCVGAVTVNALWQTLVYSALAFIVVAVADFAYQRYSHKKSLMMTKDEVKREYKESEGDPHIKGKRKQLAQEFAMSDGGAAARKGKAVIVNPTHFAVVIDYDAETTPLPVVTAKGRNMHAHRIRAEAEGAGVPVFRNPPLARALYADSPLYEPIPDELFDAVAQVLAWVTKNRATLYQGRLDHGVIDLEKS